MTDDKHREAVTIASPVTAVRIIAGAPYYSHADSLFVEYKLLKFALIMFLRVGKFIFCAIDKLLPAPYKYVLQFGSDIGLHSHDARSRDS